MTGVAQAPHDPVERTGTQGDGAADGQPPRPPLDGIRVLDFTHVLAGPFVTRLLADLGADVVRVESSKHRDSPWRSAADRGLVRPASHLVVNRGKRSIAIDLKSETGVDVARRLSERADVVTENFSAGVMTRLGLGPEMLCAANPRLVYLSMSGYGSDGPRRSWTSMNMNLQGYSGLMMATGQEDDPPTAIANSWNDYVAALHGCFAVVSALAERERTGTGRRIDLSQFECSVSTLGPLLLSASVTGQTPPRRGNRVAGAAPHGVYRCAGEDSWCAISVQTDAQWLELAALAGWDDGPAFATLAERIRCHDLLDARLEEWTATRSNVEVEELLRAQGIPAERMRDISEVLDQPGIGTVFKPFDDPHAPQLRVTGLPFAGALDVRSPAPAPLLGEHTGAVLGDWLALDENELAALQASGALV